MVDTPERIAEFSIWLTEQTHATVREPIGISCAVVEEHIAFASKERGWLFKTYNTSHLHARRGVLQQALGSAVHPIFISRDSIGDIAALKEFIDLSIEDITRCFVDDMEQLSYATGREVMPRGSMTPLKDALDCANVGPRMATTAPQFYRAVGMPVLRNLAREQLGSWPDKNLTVVYENLLLKVLAHYTLDPTITAWLGDAEVEPFTKLSEMLRLKQDETMMFLLWLCCNQDYQTLSDIYGDGVASLPDNVGILVTEVVDKQLPNLRLGLMELSERLAMQSQVTTLHDRVLPYGMGSGRTLHGVIIGGIQDILDVAVASLLNAGATDVAVTETIPLRYNGYMRGVITGFIKDNSLESQHDIKQLTELAHPLGFLSLEPQVVLT